MIYCVKCFFKSKKAPIVYVLLSSGAQNNNLPKFISRVGVPNIGGVTELFTVTFQMSSFVATSNVKTLPVAEKTTQ